MICCGGFLYVVFKIRQCISPPPASQTTTTRVRRRRRRNNTSDGDNPASSNDTTPTAPSVDKDDLPPSYDALFPARAKPESPNT